MNAETVAIVAGTVLALIAALVTFVRFVFQPRLEQLVTTQVGPLRDDISAIRDDISGIKMIVERELQPNGTPIATKVAVIQQRLDDGRCPYGAIIHEPQR